MNYDQNKFETVLVKEISHGIEVVINRVEKQNTINDRLLLDLNAVLDQAESDPKIKVVILRGQKGFFCKGMDFDERVKINKGEQSEDHSAMMRLLKRFTLSPKVIVSIVEGKVIAGGVGLVAASDFVIGTPESEFSLSEAMWGLLPANILPFIIRRTGFQKAYMMTLTIRVVSGEEALAMNLIDELSENPDTVLRQLKLKLSRISEETTSDLKKFFRKLWIIDEQMEQTAIDELKRLVQEPRVIRNIERFTQDQKFPWDE